MQWTLWLHVPFLAAIAIANGADVFHASLELAVVAGLGVLARIATTRRMQAIWLSIGLLWCSGILVHFTGGLIESHFHFFVVLPLVALYQDWRPFLAGLAFVVFHHGVIGSINPEAIYNHPAAVANPVLWAFIHGAYVLGLVAVLIFHWKFAEHAEAAVRTSEERFRNSFDKAPIGMCLANLEGSFLQVNRAFCRMLGRTEADLLSGGWSDVSHPDDLAASRDLLQKLASGLLSSGTLEKRYLRSDGSVLWGNVAVSVVTHRNHPLHLIAQIEDVTQRKEDRERLEHLVRSKDEFVASVSHELRTPLTAVVGLAEMLREETTTESERKEFLDLLVEQSVEVSNIVEDLLVAARSEIGTISVVSEAIDLGHQVEMALSALGTEARQRVRRPQGEGQAWADPARVRQIIRNLVTNALRYGGESIELRIATIGDEVTIEVCDNGLGIPEHLQERVFESYESAHDPGTQPGSVGLGLSVSRQLARLMGGDLTYRWTGTRSVFQLRLRPMPQPIPSLR